MIIVLTGIIMALIGVPVCIAGLRGTRVGVAAHCSGCNFDLSGSIASSALCPECGRSLTARHAIRVGALRRHPRWAALGVCAIVVGLALTAAPTVSRRLGIDWNRYKPVWMLLHEATYPLITPRSPSALLELERRCQAGSINSAQAGAIATRMLGAHADRSLAWDPRCADLMFAALPYHKRPREVVERYIHQLADFEVRTDPSYPHQRPTPIDLFARPPRLGSADSWWITATLESVSINGEVTEIDADDPRPSNASAGRWFQPWTSDLARRYSFSFWADAPIGEARVEATWKMRAMTGRASADWARKVHRATVKGAKSEDMKDEWDVYGEAEWTHTWTGTMNVVPPDPHRFVITDDSIPFDDIDRCVTDVHVNAGKTPDGVALWISGVFRSPPMDLAYEVRLVTPDGSKELGLIGGLADETASFFLSTGTDALDGRVVTLKFIPRADYAGRRQGMFVIDGHELVRKNLDIDWVVP